MKVLTFGEIMLPLCVPGQERLFQNNMLEATFGRGDSFAGGSICGLIHYESKQQILEFAVTSSCLKHSIISDFNRVDVPDVKKLMRSDWTG